MHPHTPFNKRFGQPLTFLKLGLAVLSFFLFIRTSSLIQAASFDTIEDLSGKATPLVMLKSQDNFSNELVYEVKIKNLSSTPFIADSLILVLDKVTNIGGFEREALKKEPIIDQIEILDQDGSTPEGKSYFYIPTGGKKDLPPLAQSLSVTVRIRNPSYVTGLTPSFRIYGTIRVPKKEEAPRQREIQIPSTPPKKNQDQFHTLLELLIQKGMITKEEWEKAKNPGSEPLKPITPPTLSDSSPPPLNLKRPRPPKTIQPTPSP